MKISRFYKLNKSQSELDFVDIDTKADLPLFIDPYAFKFRNDLWSIECNNQIVSFFECVIFSIKAKNYDFAKQLLNKLSEPKETHLGYAQKSNGGRGVSGKQSIDLFEALKNSKAVQTGFLKDLSDCELMIPGMNVDKISDITTNIIRNKLIEYTQEQCKLLNIKMTRKSSGRLWNEKEKRWISGIFTDFPCVREQPILLVPKHIVVYKPAIDAQEFYNHEVMDFIKDEHLRTNSSLVELLKDGRRRVTKKSIKERPEYHMTKEFLYDFCNRNPNVLQKYKDRKGKEVHYIKDISDIDESEVATRLISRLPTIKTGRDEATEYHNFCIGALEFIFYPHFLYPKKENEIHEGRKRIDITFHNAADHGFFNSIRTSGKIAATTIMIECKNYSHDLANPELDQITGRFSNLRGWFGFIIGRQFTDRELFIMRCKDTAKDGRGIVIPLVDEDIIRMLNHILEGNRHLINSYIHSIYENIIN